MRKIGDGQQWTTRTRKCCPAPLYPLVHSHVCSTSICSKLDTYVPYVSSSETGPRLVVNQLRPKLVKTGLSTIKNRRKPH
ncbi:hypothetical protein K443DRAFT_104921 [Laccaria amethystina LaAM-08-1]|uniref:Uncharacterized protein n=1 Tax=Laccaria amethystina LaAM-08-1 TaxID=1095629 RepID=A0A0C9WYD2_9AGAR|nr:hypothetical protein K443DRAFT_104921 [Laccaria amethystina LaAM-08-1]